NVRRVREVLRRIDTDNNSTRVIALRNAGARDIATALQGLIGTPAQGQTATASVVAVEGANSVALRGDPTTVARMAQVAADLDQKAKSGTEIRVVFLEHADAGQLLPVLQQLVGQTPDTIPQNQLSQSNFGASTNGGNAGGQPTVNTGGQTQSQAAPG
ncbi:secretin N-terminal domain-containing protein, partial [Escherichia coli]|uniref:secretin N-terminal domain-containing protein n=1 Tax=Escherichia coli TaxID=562 RepID=UPI003C6C6391